MKQKIKLGVVCLIRNTFDFNAAKKIYKGILKDLDNLENVEIKAVKEAIEFPHEAQEAGSYFGKEEVDAIAIISGTFHLGHLALEIKAKCDKPLLLWGIPELPYDGGKIRLNSVCGVNLNASNLTKSGYTDFEYIVSNTIDENWIDAVRMIVALKNARVGLLGYRADGFFNVGVSELSLYKKYGVIINHYELDDIFSYKEDKQRVQYFENKLRKNFCVSGVTDKQVLLTATLAAKIEKFMEDAGISVMAIRCWPEFAKGYGVAPCGAMSLLQDEGLILSCEGDIDCALTMLCHKAAGAKTPFMADLSQINIEENFALMWHCGVAPCSLQDGKCTATLDTYFAGGKGVTAGFVMKSGEISIARLDSINGQYRIFLEKGKAVPMEKELTGTYAKCIFDRGMKKVLDKVVYSGIAHHVSLIYGDKTRVFEIFARLTKTGIVKDY
ncbi:MAG TPA: fucose isomerase [Clostridiales bacterium]|nr:fucose isomerase [Clostridiales bacterium]